MRSVFHYCSNLNISYETKASISYAVIKMPSESEVLGYQVEMIRENKLPGIVPLDIRQKNNTFQLYYNITSMLSLNQYLTRTKLKKHQFINMLTAITKTLIMCKDYFLSPNQFIMETEYIYINPATQVVFLMYMPTAMSTDMVLDFKELVIDLITRKANLASSSDHYYLQKLLEALKIETFELSNFERQLQMIGNNCEDEIEQTNGIEKNITTEKAEAPILRVENVQCPKSKTLEEKSAVALDKRKQSPENMRKMVMIVASQIILIIAMSFVFAAQSIRTLSNDPAALYVGIGIIVLAFDFLFLKKVVLYSDTDVKIDNDDIPQVSMNTRTIRNVSDVEMFQDKSISLSKAHVHNDEMDIKNMKADKIEESQDIAVLSADVAEETTVLTEEKSNHACLEGVNNGLVENIPILSAHFIIGRLREQVDYVSQNGAVGKVHAEIIMHEDQYMLKDLNSRNGTYINGMRIDSNKAYVITSNDKIAFANSEYTFKIY